jgi:hypothetical protein
LSQIGRRIWKKDLEHRDVKCIGWRQWIEATEATGAGMDRVDMAGEDTEEEAAMEVVETKVAASGGREEAETTT